MSTTAIIVIIIYKQWHFFNHLKKGEYAICHIQSIVKRFLSAAFKSKNIPRCTTVVIYVRRPGTVAFTGEFQAKTCLKDDVIMK